MRGNGQPCVIIHVLPQEQEEREYVRQNLQHAVEQIISKRNGYETKVVISRVSEEEK